MLLSDKFWEMAEHFMEVVCTETGFPVVVFDEKGCIVRATDAGRIGDLHAGAEKIMQGLVDEYAVPPEEAARNTLVREEYSCPIVIDGRRVAAFGITGKLDLAKPLARVAAKMIDSWIEAIKHQEQLVRSERKYRSIFDHSAQGIFQTTLDGRLLTANAALAEMYAYPSPEALVAEMTDVARQVYVVPEDRERLIDRLQENGRVTGFLTQYRRRDGRIIDVSINAHFVHDPETGRPLIEGIIENITARKQAEAALKKSEEKYFKAFNNSPVWVVLSSLETGRYIEINETFVDAIGYSREEIIGRTALEIGSWVDLSDRRKIQDAIREKGYVRNLEVRRRTKDGRILTMLFSAEIIDVSGEICMLSVSQDISEYKKAQKELETSHNVMQSFLNAVPDLLIVVDREFHIHYSNDKGHDLVLRDKDVQCRTCYGRFKQLSAPCEDCSALPVFESGKAVTREMVNPADGRTREVRAFPIFDASGRVSMVVEHIRDISDIKAAQEEIRQRRQFLELVLYHAPDAIVTMDAAHRVIDWNPGAERIFGYTPEEAIGRQLDDLVAYGESRREAGQKTRQVLTGKSVEAFETIRYRKDGSPLHVIASGSPIVVDGVLKGIVAVYTDITKQKKIETERKAYEARIQQMQKMEAIGMLAGGIAHDFNNILSAVIGYADLALMDMVEESRAHNNIRQIHSAGMRARDLVQQILTFSRQDERELKPLQIGSQVKEALKMLRSSLPTTIEISSLIATEVDNVMADPTQIHQIVMNLCTNAAQAMEENGGQMTVRLSQVTLTEEDVRLQPSLRTGDYAKLSVQDTGTGIPVDILDKIYNPYFTTKEKGKGTGLGLAVVHGIVQSYGGDIQVESASGRGTTFHIYLPTIKAPTEASPKETSLPKGIERILIVDDEAFIVDFGRQGLERLGYRVEGCSGGVEALERFRKAPDRFDLVITDMTMPKMTGDQLAMEILKLRPNIPIILCTGYSSRIDNQKAKKIGIRAMLMKPVNLSNLANNVRRILDEPASGE